MDNNTLYISGRNHGDTGVSVFKTENGGSSWENITNNLQSPNGSEPSSIVSMGNGKIIVAINDRQLQIWQGGKLFRSDNDGQIWNEANFGSTESGIFPIFLLIQLI
ncbi:exo-alpha-sialidase [candidate division KSB1 bacterium]|nr:exo-alpha-sialidase [candidate division KSB1 bacterium]